MLSSYQNGDYKGGMNRFEIEDHFSMDGKGGGIDDGKFNETRLEKGTYSFFEVK